MEILKVNNGKRFTDNTGNDTSDIAATVQQITWVMTRHWLTTFKRQKKLARCVASGAVGRPAVCVLLLLHFLQRVPLRDRSARVCEHVAPMSQLRACRSATERDAADRIWGTDAIVVHHRNHQRHFLQSFKSPLYHYTSQQHKQKYIRT